MNERLEQLKRQAVGYAEEVFDYHGKDYREIVMEKFAELIIRECLSITKKQYNDTLPWGGVEDTIKEHFGVEE